MKHTLKTLSIRIKSVYKNNNFSGWYWNDLKRKKKVPQPNTETSRPKCCSSRSVGVLYFLKKKLLCSRNFAASCAQLPVRQKPCKLYFSITLNIATEDGFQIRNDERERKWFLILWAGESVSPVKRSTVVLVWVPASYHNSFRFTISQTILLLKYGMCFWK